MSLEAALAENTAAVKELTEQLKVSNANRAEALEKLTAAPAGAAKTTKAAKTKPEPEVEDFSGEKGAEKVREAFAGYMDVTDDAEKAARKATLKTILAKVGAAKSVEIGEKHRAKVMGWVRALSAGENVPELAPAEPEDDDEM